MAEAERHSAFIGKIFYNFELFYFCFLTFVLLLQEGKDRPSFEDRLSAVKKKVKANDMEELFMKLKGITTSNKDQLVTR